MILSYTLWQKDFGGQPDIVGQTITLNDVPQEVIGVMPRTFKEPYNNAELWRPFPNQGGENFVANARFWGVIGRLKPGVSLAKANAELSTIAARFAQNDSKFYQSWNFSATPLRDHLVRNFAQGLLLVVGASVVVLVITCANVAGLQIVRASARRREVAIRLALGASRLAVAREHLTESLLLVLCGGVGGALIGSWGVDLLLASLARDWIPRGDEIALNLPVLCVTGAIALLTGLVFGIYPAWRATKVNAVDALQGAGKTSAGLQSVRLRSTLVVAQIALTLVLLVCAGLVWKSFSAIMRVSPGMQIENTLSMVLTLAPTQYDTSAKRSDYYQRLLEKMESVPGVQSAALTQTMPFRWGIPASFSIYGSSDQGAKLPPTYYDSVSPSFFRTTHIPLLAGRIFNADDRLDSPSVVVLSASTAQKYFPGQNAVGQRLFLPSTQPKAKPQILEVIGVVGDVPRDGLDAETPYQAYASLGQRGTQVATLLVRSPLPVESITQTVERAVHDFNPDQTISNVASVRTLVNETLTQPELFLTLFSLFALLALLLAGIGLYGLVAYSVAQRKREFGIRIALGAQATDVLRLVVGQGARLTVAGVILGVLGAVAVAQLMKSLLFQTEAYDPLVFLGVVLGLSAIALLAAFVPALRATKVNPVSALRSE